MVEALLVGERIGVMHRGRLVQIGTPAELLQSPADDYVHQLMNTPRRQAALVDSLLDSAGPRPQGPGLRARSRGLGDRDSGPKAPDSESS
jgi:ABC-type proline/glycine betaine transport system ATPase subunit